MKKNLTLIIFVTLALALATSGRAQYHGPEPDTIPKVYGENIVSLPIRYEFGSAFTSDGKDFYFGVDQNFSVQEAGRVEMWHSSFDGASWSEPKVFLSDPNFSHNDPMLSPDQSRLYFISSRPLEGNEPKDIDIWYVERRGDGWSDPINVGPPINTDVNEYFISFNSSGDMYYSSNFEAGENKRDFDIYKSKWVDGKFQTPEKLPPTINTQYYEADVFVAPDESYLIFCSARRGGLGQGDLYISFNEGEGWTEAKNMGEKINDPGHQLCPFVTADGKYFFYTSNKDIYWVSTEIFESYK